MTLAAEALAIAMRGESLIDFSFSCGLTVEQVQRMVDWERLRTGIVGEPVDLRGILIRLFHEPADRDTAARMLLRAYGLGYTIERIEHLVPLRGLHALWEHGMKLTMKPLEWDEFY